MKFIIVSFAKALIFTSGIRLFICILCLLPSRIIAQEQGGGLEKAASIDANKSLLLPPPQNAVRNLTSQQISRSPLPAPPAEIAPARFIVTVYEVMVPQKRIVDLDAETLESQAVSQQNLLNALKELGETRVLVKIDQAVNLYDESIKLRPTRAISESWRSPRQLSKIPDSMSVTYFPVGLNVNISANPSQQPNQMERLCIQVIFQISSVVEIELSTRIKTSRIMNVTLNHSGMPKFGKPTVLLGVTAPVKEHSLAYVVCYGFKEIGK